MRTGPVQEVGFRLVAARERARLASGTQVLDLEAKSRVLTSVIRIPADLSIVLTERVAALTALEGHYLYPPTDLHVTVLNLDDAPGLAPAETVEVAASVLAATAGFPVLLGGVSLSRSSVYARAYDPSGALREARARLSSATGCRGPRALRWLGFVNVARFTRPLTADVVTALAPLRRADARPSLLFEATSVEIVRTDVVLSEAGTEVVRSVRLAGPRPG